MTHWPFCLTVWTSIDQTRNRNTTFIFMLNATEMCILIFLSISFANNLHLQSSTAPHVSVIFALSCIKMPSVNSFMQQYLDWNIFWLQLAQFWKGTMLSQSCPHHQPWQKLISAAWKMRCSVAFCWKNHWESHCHN